MKKQITLTLIACLMASHATPSKAEYSAGKAVADIAGVSIGLSCLYFAPKIFSYLLAKFNPQPAVVAQSQKPLPQPAPQPKIQTASQNIDAYYVDSLDWILQNTKPCPQCGARIEKNGGCDYMQCPLCKCEFCWLCKAYHDHKTHKCKK